MAKDPKLAAGESAVLENFLRAVVRSGLLDAAMLQAAREEAPPEARQDAKALAEYFVKVGKLTRFQAGKLLKGVSLGLVFGPYHILSPLGRGGMGSVFLARDSRTQLLVAVKVLPPKQAKAKERLLARFRREMDICKRVAHPNLTRTFEVGEQLGINFIAMEFIPGRDLYHLVREKGPLDAVRVGRLFSEVAEGLEAAHTMGLIHRDMKPSNVMILPDDHAKVLDLGLALIAGDREPTILAGGQGVLIGTPDYMAPEQGEDPLKVDTRSDIYGLGCTLYYAVTGQVPFPGGGALQKIVRHKCDLPPSAATVNPKVPADFAALIMRMMAKQPDERFQSAAEVRQAIVKWLDEYEAANGDAAAPDALPINGPLEPRPPEAVLVAQKQGAAPGKSMPVPPAPEPPPAKPTPAAKTPAKPISPLAVGLAALAKADPAGKPLPKAEPLPPGNKPAASLPVAALAKPAAPAKPPAADKPQFPPPVVERTPAPATPPPPLGNGEAAGDTPASLAGSQTLASMPPPPFWLDYLAPVLAGTLFLLVLWFASLYLLIRSGGQ